MKTKKKTPQSDFDYESKVWGGISIKPSPFYIQGLKLQYTLEDLSGVKGKVIDIGCGGGNMAKAIKAERSDLDVYGIDISKVAIREAKKSSGGVTFKLGSSEKIPFPKNYFDALTMYDVLEHVEDQLACLKEAKRVLKPGGVFHLFLPLDGQTGTIYALLKTIGWKSKIKFTGHTIAYTDKDALRIYKKAGFKVIKKRFSFHYFFSIFDFLYFTFLDIFKIEPKASIEGEIKRHKGSFVFQVFNFFYRIVVAIGYIESILLKDVPGGGGDYLLKKTK
jgi:ubiquinone/menaquinone biosynthesis C-methylase UbiE